MVKTAFRFIFFVALFFPAIVLHAKELSAYKTGDIADEDIVASVPLDIIDPVETAARREAEAKKTPTIFLSLPDAPVTNAMAKEFSMAFATTRSNFVSALAQKFPAGGIIDASNFSDFLAGFNRGNKSFPVSDELAHKWAAGDAAADIQDRYFGYLLRMMRRPIRADELPPGFVLSDTFRLVFVNGPDDKPTLADADHGKMVSEVTSLSRLQMLLRRQFTSADDQALARALGVFLKPNCILDAELTKQARDRDTRQLVVAAHYAAGEIIVRKGETVDAKVKAALVALDEKLAPARLAQQMAEQSKAQQEQLRQQQLAAQRDKEQALAQAQAAAQAQTDKIRRDAAIAMQNQVESARIRTYWIVGIAGGILIVVLATVLVVARRKPEMGLVSATAESAPHPQRFQLQSSVQKELVPQVTQVVKEAVVQELAAQRGELLRVQQSAAAELAELVHRLDRLQAPLNDRLRAYENRIAELEKQLASRTEENRELLKAKIELTRQQLETERAAIRSDWRGAIN